MICKSRSGTRKLLAVSAVLAMAFCVFAAAVPADAADGTEVPTYTMYDNKSVIKWTAANGTTTDKTLKEAMGILQDGSITSGTMTFPAGNFDVAWGDGSITGSAFIINASNVTITAEEKGKTLVYCSEVTSSVPNSKGDGEIDRESINNITAHFQNTITIRHAVTIDGFVLMNIIKEEDEAYTYMKSICVDGTDSSGKTGTALLKNCTLMPNDKVEEVDYNKISGSPRGGTFLITKGNMEIEDSILHDGVINSGWAGEKTTLSVKNTVIFIESNKNGGFNNLKKDDNGNIVTGPTATAENVTIKVVSNDAWMGSVISRAVPGVTIDVEADAKLNISAELQKGVELNISKGYSLSVPSGIELNISEGSDVNIDGTLNVYGKLASSGTISGNGTVFADQDSVIPSDLADDITVTHPFVPMPDEDDEFPEYVPSQPSSDDSSDDDSTTQVAIVAAAIAVVLIAIIALLYKSR